MTLISKQLLNERYEIIEKIGQGGFGAVYKAWDRVVKQPCAVKENLDASPEAKRQFQREALFLAGLNHPNLPRVTDRFFIPELGQYLVMDFIEGEDLYLMLTRLGILPEEEVISWIMQVCEALEYLHSQIPPIIHRDIKPQNIIITPQGKAMLVDFGLSKVYDERLSTSIGARGGTSGFAPPEQYGQGRTDVRSDIYSLGATLYTLLTKKIPPDSIDRLVHNTPLIKPRYLNKTLNPSLERAILKAIQIDSKNRYQTVKDIQQALNPNSRQASPIPSWGWAVGGAIVVILIIAIALFSIGTSNRTSANTSTPAIAGIVITATATTQTLNTATATTVTNNTNAITATTQAQAVTTALAEARATNAELTRLQGKIQADATAVAKLAQIAQTVAASQTPISTPAQIATSTPTSVTNLPTGTITLIEPATLTGSDIPSISGKRDFIWEFSDSDPRPDGFGFEIRLRKEGENSWFGVHDAVKDNEENIKINENNKNQYSLTIDLPEIMPIIQNQAGSYIWTVFLVQLEPSYNDLSLQNKAEQEFQIIYAPPINDGGNNGSSSGGDKGSNDGGDKKSNDSGDNGN